MRMEPDSLHIIFHLKLYSGWHTTHHCLRPRRNTLCLLASISSTFGVWYKKIWHSYIQVQTCSTAQCLFQNLLSSVQCKVNSSLEMNSSMFRNCSIFCDVRHVRSLVLGQNVMFGSVRHSWFFFITRDLQFSFSNLWGSSNTILYIVIHSDLQIQ